MEGGGGGEVLQVAREAGEGLRVELEAGLLLVRGKWEGSASVQREGRRPSCEFQSKIQEMRRRAYRSKVGESSDTSSRPEEERRAEEVDEAAEDDEVLAKRYEAGELANGSAGELNTADVGSGSGD